MRIAALIVTSLLLAACAPGAPDIDVARTHDMGAVTKGELAVADLSVQNLGGAPLTVEAVSTSCGCTKATLTPMIIPPGGEARLHVEYDSDAHEIDLGPIKRSIYISSDDPDEDDVQIIFSVLVQPRAS
jgi:hypothetical protein